MQGVVNDALPRDRGCMDESTRTGTLQRNERAQYAFIGIALTILGLQLVVLLTSESDGWSWLMVGGPVAMLIAASSNLRRIRRRG